MNIKELAEQAGFNDFPNDENGVWITDGYRNEELKRFAELVAEQAHTNNKAKWYQEGYEAGQHDEREACAEHYLAIMRDAVEQAILREREACAKLCLEQDEYGCGQYAKAIRARGDGVALTNTQHPEGDPVPDDHEIKPDSLETVEIEIPMSINEINEAFDHEYEIHSKDPVYRIIRACGLSTANSDIHPFALERIIEDIKAAEREACIKLLDDFSKTNMVPAKDTWRMGLIAGANALRARGEKMKDEDDDIQEYKKPWVGLTDEECDEIWGECLGVFDCLKMTEAKLKEKNA